MTAPTPDTDVAYAAGAEAMREACADYLHTWIAINSAGTGVPRSTNWTPAMLTTLARMVARLPLPPAPETQTETTNGNV